MGGVQRLWVGAATAFTLALAVRRCSRNISLRVTSECMFSLQTHSTQMARSVFDMISVCNFRLDEWELGESFNLPHTTGNFQSRLRRRCITWFALKSSTEVDDFLVPHTVHAETWLPLAPLLLLGSGSDSVASCMAHTGGTFAVVIVIFLQIKLHVCNLLHYASQTELPTRPKCLFISHIYF